MRFAVLLFALLAVGCSKVPAGNVGIKVYLLGGSKGVDHEVLGVGRYWIGVNEDLYLFPTFEQNPKYSTSDDDSGAPFNFQTKEGMTCEADFSVTYHIEPTDAAKVFQKYRLGIDEINRGPLRNIVRDALNEVASTLPVEAVYGEGKTKMVDDVQKLVAERATLAGITVSQVSLLGAIRLPNTVVGALNSKIEATQRAQQRENELREAEAQAKKDVAAAEGEAQRLKALAEGRAAATLTEAEAQAQANKILAESLTTPLIEYRKIDKWNGALPTVTSNGQSLINLGQVTK
jgi:regulator of protease activity HflC (stomatin/prohibitin superfamily)